MSFNLLADAVITVFCIGGILGVAIAMHLFYKPRR